MIGLGYIGLPTAAVLATCGLQVTGVDVNPKVIAAVSAGKVHIVEPGLERLVEAAVADGRLEAANRPCPADAFLITVPTPVRHDDRQPDMRYVDAAAAAIAHVLRPGNLVVLESTSPVGTTRRMARLMAELRPDLRFPGDDGADGDVDFAYSPERVIPGRTLIELRDNSRVVGGMTPRAGARAAALYGTFVRNDRLVTDDRTAEMVKLIENAFRDVNIAFANELSMICDDLGLDVWRVIALANRHPRVSILKPGAGVGGHCIAVDPWFVVASAPERARLIRTARHVNDSKPDFIVDRVTEALDGKPMARVACLGLAFKADVDDFRESPALHIARLLTAAYPGRVMCAD
ncbi:MAG TPA: UDP-N-acetyl-D-mannosamine dehydrogenase, partial [Rhodospirillales bacterium]|nr:UDP-N-acetyl-D-mannosamine dehydrogenase [Rhodospirillales bacterium]